MLRTLKYLKSYWLYVLFIICTIFGQVQFELALPEYMSNIITNGIQDSGITDKQPIALTKNTHDLLNLFLDEKEKEIFQQSYVFVNQNDSQYIDAYPALKQQDIYVYQGNQDVTFLEQPFLIQSMLQNPEILSRFQVSNTQQLIELISHNPQIKTNILQEVSKMTSNFTNENLHAQMLVQLKNEYTSLGINVESLQNRYILHEGLLMILLTLGSVTCAIISSYLSSKVATGVSRKLREDVFTRVEEFCNEEFSKFSTASLITRTTNDIQQVQQVLTMMLRLMLFAPFMGLTSLFKVLKYRNMVFLLGYAILIITVLLIITFAITLPKFKTIQKFVDKLNLVTRQQLSGMLVVRAFNNQSFEEKEFDEVNQDITKINIFVNKAMTTIMPTMQFILSVVSVLIIWYGSHQIDLGTMQIGDMLAFLQYAIHVLISFLFFSMVFIMLPRGSVSSKRIFEVLDTKIQIQDPIHPKQLPSTSSEIVFDHVYFQYPHAQEYVLEDINFTVKPGETIAFIGSTGSGKSTLVNLLPRFFDVSKGEITIGGINIKDVKQSELREEIGYISQKGILFSGTIESNLKYGKKDATEEEMDEALRIAQAKEFVDRMPEGVKTPITEGGTNVSGGQKQRLSIARAVIKQPKIYIFDDTFSALDYKTDSALRLALNQLIKKTQATVFIVGQRVRSIMHADQIIVLDKGKVVGHGTHDQLMKDCEVYQEIAYSQLSRKELGNE